MCNASTLCLLQDAATAGNYQPDGDSGEGNVEDVDAELQALAEVLSLHTCHATYFLSYTKCWLLQQPHCLLLVLQSECWHASATGHVATLDPSASVCCFRR